MPLNGLFERHKIKGKDVYVIDPHHNALAAWVLVRRAAHIATNLITNDHHTDTNQRFWGRYLGWSGGGRTRALFCCLEIDAPQRTNPAIAGFGLKLQWHIWFPRDPVSMGTV